METISRGTLNVLKLAANTAIKSFLFISSGAVYGTQPPELKQTPEDFLRGPDISKAISGYAEGKRYTEVLCSIFRDGYGIPIKIARLFTFIGPYLDLNAEYAATDFIKKCISKEPIVIKSDGTPVRSYCYSADLAVALWSILLGDNPSDVYNVGSDEEISVADLARLIASCFEHETRISINAALPEQGTLPQRYIPDIFKLKRDFHYALKYSNGTAVRRTVEWMIK
jgi:dTDP-glucose 4,6-dehydratase